VGFGSRLVLVVEPHRTVGTEVICVARFGWITAFDAIQSTSGDHFPLSLKHEIDLFRSFMMMRGVRATRREVHPEETRYHVRRIDSVALSTFWPKHARSIVSVGSQG